jgi:hypothetical protein
MIVDAAQLLHFKVVVNMMDRGNGLSKQHVAPNVVNRQEEALVVQDVDCVHLIILIELEELHYVVLQSDLLLYLLTDLFHVHVVILLILLIDFIDTNEDLIVITIK